MLINCALKCLRVEVVYGSKITKLLVTQTFQFSSVRQFNKIFEHLPCNYGNESTRLKIIKLLQDTRARFCPVNMMFSIVQNQNALKVLFF